MENFKNKTGHTPHSLENITKIRGGHLLHYTCNAPKQNILDKYKIKSLGEQYGCKDNREVVMIPLELFTKRFGSIPTDKNQQVINAEIILKNLK